MYSGLFCQPIALFNTLIALKSFFLSLNQDEENFPVTTHIYRTVVSCQQCICKCVRELAVKISGIGKCTEICYKDPVLEDRQWSAYIDRSPGRDSYSLVSTSFCCLTDFTVHSSYCCPSATFLIFYLSPFVYPFALHRIMF
jgi:hypothetical protein